MRLATSLADRIATGTSVMLVPSRIRLVDAATAESATNGSRLRG